MISGKLVFVALVMLPIAAGLTSGFSLPVIIVTVFFWQRLVIQKSRSLIICTLCIILLLNIRFHHFQLNDTSITMSESEWVTIAVKQTSWKVDGDKLEFEGRIETGELSDKVRATYYIKEEGERNRLAEMIPKTVVVKGTLSTPHEPSNFNQFNYKTYLKSKTISQILKVSDLLIPHQFEEKGSHYYVLDSMRQKVLSHIDQTMTPQTGGYTKTLLFADKRTFSTDVMDSFKELGIIHLLSISGLHIVFIINLLSRFLLRMNVSKEATQSSLLMILPIYGITTGLGISVIRAIGQSWIKLSGEKLGVKVSALDSWSIMLLISLIMQPYNLYAIGFQLSFLISLVIILISHQEFTKNWSSIKKYIGMNTLLLLVSIPVLSYHFYEFSWGVLVLNSLFIPFVANILLPLLIISFMLSIIIPRSALFLGVLFLVDELIGGMESIVSTVSRSFSFTFITGRLSQSAYFLLVLAILLLFIRLERGKSKRFLIGPVTGILLCLLSVRYSPWGQVLMIDVGQGEAILIKEPWGRGSYLIDTGGQVEFPVKLWQKREKSFKVGENILVPVLKSEGVHRLESIIITHPDIDHYGAMLDILSEVQTKQVISAKASFLQKNFQVLFPSIESYGTIIKEAIEGSSADLPSNTYAILSHKEIGERSKNDSSLVLYGLIGHKTWLFTGDLETDGENVLLAKYPDMTVDVLKVGHHGSLTSTHEAFLNQITPDTAWISSGEANRYGHPHNSVIERLTAQNVAIYRTDTHGAVKYKYYDRYPFINPNSDRFSFEQKGKLRGE